MIGAKEAFDIGLVDRIVEGELHAACGGALPRRCATFARCPRS